MDRKKGGRGGESGYPKGLLQRRRFPPTDIEHDFVKVTIYEEELSQWMWRDLVKATILRPLHVTSSPTLMPTVVRYGTTRGENQTKHGKEHHREK